MHSPQCVSTHYGPGVTLVSGNIYTATKQKVSEFWCQKLCLHAFNVNEYHSAMEIQQTQLWEVLRMKKEMQAILCKWILRPQISCHLETLSRKSCAWKTGPCVNPSVILITSACHGYAIVTFLALSPVIEILLSSLLLNKIFLLYPQTFLCFIHDVKARQFKQKTVVFLTKILPLSN